MVAHAAEAVGARDRKVWGQVGLEEVAPPWEHPYLGPGMHPEFLWH